MEKFYIGYILGAISFLAVYIFIQSIRGRKKYVTGTIEERIDRNNNDIRSGFDRSETELDTARRLNTGLGNINKEAVNGIDDTERTVSEIIATAKRKGSAKHKD